MSVTLGVPVPPTRAASAGRTALVSEELMSTVSVTLVTVFQKVSTAFTVALKAAPAVRVLGVPVLPLTVPGALVSPGARSWSWTNAAELTTMLLETALLRLPLVNFRLIVVATLSERLVKVTSPLPAVIFVVARNVPLPRVRLAGTTVLLSLLRRLANLSSNPHTGRRAKGSPAPDR